MITKKIALRKKIKKKKPSFMRQDAHKKKRLEKMWRRPKGLHSKMRLKLKGYRRSVSKGYKSPKEVRGFDRRGLKNVLVSSPKGLKVIKKESEGVIIAKVGLRKKMQILREALKTGITVLNIKNAEEFLKSAEEKLKERKEKKAKKAEPKKRKEAVKKEKTIEEKVKEEEKTGKEKKEEEKKELDKLLTKKEG